jgi:hypothetical protein
MRIPNYVARDAMHAVDIALALAPLLKQWRSVVAVIVTDLVAARHTVKATIE